MNKRKMFLSLAVFLFILSAIIFSLQSCAKKRTEQSAPSPVPLEPAKTVTITAVGDCTLATDAYAAQIKSFEETAQENDYSYFFQNVRNIFAEDNLIPREQYIEFVQQACFDLQSIREFADSINRDPGIVLGRLQNDKKVDSNDWTLEPLRHKYKVRVIL